MPRYILFVILATITAVAVFYRNTNNKHSPLLKNIYTTTAPESFKSYSKELALCANDNGYNKHYCFLIDMKIPSGKKDFLCII